MSHHYLMNAVQERPLSIVLYLSTFRFVFVQANGVSLLSDTERARIVVFKDCYF